MSTLDFAMRKRTVLVAVLLVAAAAVATVAPVAAHEGHEVGSSFVVDLNRDGSARVTLALAYDLETDDERTAFRTLENDSEARADARERFRERMASVAAAASEATGRDMQVSDPAIDLSVTDNGSVGVAELSVTWTALAATGDGEVVVTEPFASGFEPEGEFRLQGPDGYTVERATPSPDGRMGNALTWQSGTDLSGFTVTFVSTGGDGSSGEGDILGGVSAPGFGPVAALAALVGAALLWTRRRA